MNRCGWVTNETLKQYHDNEHGNLPPNNSKLFELLTLEIFQPGLSWNVVLNKRDGLKTYFKDYNLKRICDMDEHDIADGLTNDSIIKHRQKITAVINNAKLIINNDIDLLAYLLDNIDYRFGHTQVGVLLSKQMKKDGYKFVGPSVATSLLEAIGLLPHHLPECQLADNDIHRFQYPTQFGTLVIEYQNFTILSSSWFSNETTTEYLTTNSFEHFIIYHLDNYLSTATYNFKLHLNTIGTKFQELVWDAARHVPTGSTMTYGDLAWSIGSGAFRAVGSAMRKSNFSLFIPAHRIVGSKNIGGFNGQVELKRQLLKHEGNCDYS